MRARRETNTVIDWYSQLMCKDFFDSRVYCRMRWWKEVPVRDSGGALGGLILQGVHIRLRLIFNLRNENACSGDQAGTMILEVCKAFAFSRLLSESGSISLLVFV
jgi:hypothetical protein